MDRELRKLKKDKYSRSRGGHSRLLEIRCGKCDELVCYYQKDGPGLLKRMYIDRISKTYADAGKKLTCHKCNNVLGVRYLYEKEKRPAYRIFVGTVKKIQER
jgi:ribosomal protein S27E